MLPNSVSSKLVFQDFQVRPQSEVSSSPFDQGFFCPDTFQAPIFCHALTLDKIKETLRPTILPKIRLIIHHLEADFIGKKNCTTVVSNIQDRIFGTGRCTKETLDGLLRDVLARKFNNKGLHYPTPFFRDGCLVFTFFVFQYDVMQTIRNFFDKHPKNKSHQQEIETYFSKMCSFTAIKKYIDGTQLKLVLNTSFIKENVIDQATSKNIWEKLNNIKILDSSGYILVPKEDVHHQLTHLDLEPQKKCHVLSVLNSFFSNCFDQHSVTDFLCQNCDFSMLFNEAVFNYVSSYEGFK